MIIDEEFRLPVVWKDPNFMFADRRTARTFALGSQCHPCRNNGGVKVRKGFRNSSVEPAPRNAFFLGL
jgi:hypothetical protein